MSEPWAADDEAWRGDLHLTDWPEQAYLPEGEYALFRSAREEGTWLPSGDR